jgi:hypothetical protein
MVRYRAKKANRSYMAKDDVLLRFDDTLLFVKLFRHFAPNTNM